MAKQTDKRFTLSDDSNKGPLASSSKLMSEEAVSTVSRSEHLQVEVDPISEQDSGQEDDIDELGEGMDADGFIVKPLTPEALAAFRAAQETAGVIYISRIPPGMQPTKVRHLMSQYGEVGRVYLQKEGKTICAHDYAQDPNVIRSQIRNVLICVANTPPLRSHTILKAGLNSKTKKLLVLSQKC
jgi:hypothetical protein